MRRSPAFHLRGIALLTWAAVLLGFQLSGRLPSYLHPDFRPLVPVAGCTLLALAILYYWLGNRTSGCCDGHHGHSGGGGGAGGKLTFGGVLSFLVLVVPVVTAKLVSPDEFSATAMFNRWSVQSTLPPASAESSRARAPGGQAVAAGGDSSFAGYLRRNEDGQIIAEVLDLMFGIEDAVIRRDFQGREVAIVGQFMPADSHNPAGNRFRLARMFMWCCAADSRPISILVEGETEAEPGDWLQVTGTATFPLEGGQRLAVVEAESLVPTSAPAESMLY